MATQSWINEFFLSGFKVRRHVTLLISFFSDEQVRPQPKFPFFHTTTTRPTTTRTTTQQCSTTCDNSHDAHTTSTTVKAPNHRYSAYNYQIVNGARDTDASRAPGMFFFLLFSHTIYQLLFTVRLQQPWCHHLANDRHGTKGMMTTTWLPVVLEMHLRLEH